MKFIGLQAGHQNITTNCDLALRPGTGAPGEEPINVAVRDALGQILISKGFQVQLDDANANCQELTTGKDFDFYLALHCEANVHGKGGGFMTAPDPNFDQNNTESKRIITAIKGEYFKNSGIEENEAWITPAMTQYYMWNSLTAKTPCGIIEMGVAQDAHDKVILADSFRVANAIARGICEAFGVVFDQTNPAPISPTEPTVDSRDNQITQLKKQVEELSKRVDPKYLQFAETVQKALNDLG